MSSLDGLVGCLVKRRNGNFLLKIFPEFEKTTVKNILGILKYFRETRADDSIGITDLSLVEVQRQARQLTGSQLTDIMCFYSSVSKKNRENFLVKPSAFVPFLIKRLEDLSPSQLGLAGWADSALVEPILTVLEKSPEKIVGMSLKSKALISRSAVKGIPTSESPSIATSRFVDFLPLLELSADIKRTHSLQEAAVLLHACAGLRALMRKLTSGDPGYLNNIIYVDLVPRINHLLRQTSRSQPGIETLLTIAHGFARIGFKSQPVVVDLYRLLYAKCDSMTHSQAAFSFYLFTTESGVRDVTVAEAFRSSIRDISGLSNNNLVNLLVGVDRSQSADTDFNEKVLDEVYSRKEVLKPGQLVMAIGASQSLEGRSLPCPLTEMVSKRLKEFSFSEITCLFGIETTDTEFKWVVQRELTERVRGRPSEGWHPEDLMKIAVEIRKLGPYKVKANLRVRFNQLLVISIKNRKIPTTVVLNNLRLIDDIGTWHCLPMRTQIALWSKASDVQKIDARAPLDPERNDPPEVRRRRIDTSKLLIDLSRKDQSEEKMKVVDPKKFRDHVDEESLELEAAVSQDQSPAKKFIDMLRKRA